MISQEVFSKLHSFIDNQVEFLAVDCEETNYQLVNVLNVLDCVDKVKSKAETAGNGAVVTYLSMVFNQEKIPGSTLIFKIPELVSRRVYVTDAFLKLVKQFKFKGLQCAEVWDSEKPYETYEESVRKLELHVEQLEKSSKDSKFSYEEAVKKVNQGLAVASGKWKMQLDSIRKVVARTIDLRPEISMDHADIYAACSARLSLARSGEIRNVKFSIIVLRRSGIWSLKRRRKRQNVFPGNTNKLNALLTLHLLSGTAPPARPALVPRPPSAGPPGRPDPACRRSQATSAARPAASDVYKSQV